MTPDPGPADQPGGPPGQFPITAQRLSADEPVVAGFPPRAEVVPLLGQRPSARVLDSPRGPEPLSVPPRVIPGTLNRAPVQQPAQPSVPVQWSAQPSVIPDARQSTSVQRSAHAPAPVSRPDGRVWAEPGRPAPGHGEPAAGYADPGAIAVARGLARRDPDGSVVFDLRPAPAPPGPFPAPSYDDPADQPIASTGSWETIQRQEADGPADAPAPSSDQGPITATTAAAPTSSAAPVPAGTPAPAAASPQLDELARQLFGPLTARLKAELRLDRERTGLLTDLRQ